VANHDSASSAPRVVVVHDYLTQRGGAERVAMELLRAFPGAGLVTSVYSIDRTFPGFAEFDVQTLWPQRVPWIHDDARRLFPVLAGTFERKEVRNADLVICSSSGWAHGVTTRAPKIVYCHNPARWLYQQEEFLSKSGGAVATAARVLTERQRRRDRRWASGADCYLANSTTVQRRVFETYGIRARVLHPPRGLAVTGGVVPVEGLQAGFFLTISRARGYKNVDRVVAAVEQHDGPPLVVVGTEPADARHFTGVHWTGPVSDAQLRWLYVNCLAVVGAATEDFGLTPVEGHAFGKPSLCWRRGGYLDSVQEGVNGWFFNEMRTDSIRAGLRAIESTQWDVEQIKRTAEEFSPGYFRAQMRTIAAEITGLNFASASV